MCLAGSLGGPVGPLPPAAPCLAQRGPGTCRRHGGRRCSLRAMKRYEARQFESGPGEARSGGTRPGEASRLFRGGQGGVKRGGTSGASEAESGGAGQRCPAGSSRARGASTRCGQARSQCRASTAFGAGRAESDGAGRAERAGAESSGTEQRCPAGSSRARGAGTRHGRARGWRRASAALMEGGSNVEEGTRRLRVKRSQWWSVKGDARVVRCGKIRRDVV